MSRVVTLTPADPSYPERLRALATPPRTITIEGGPLVASRAVAIIGARAALDESAEFAAELAAAVVAKGHVVVSGGAEGIDTAAHRGALDAGGRTWVVAPTGRGRTFPRENAGLFDSIAASDGAMIWPFPDGTPPLPGCFFRRNTILVALADVVVVIQAGADSGTLNASASARKLGRPVWVAPGPPWRDEFIGSLHLLAHCGARLVTSKEQFLRTFERSITQRSLFTAPTFEDAAQAALYEACAAEPRHVDEIALRARVCASAAATGLLTLALENVLVEGPEGFYRRAN